MKLNHKQYSFKTPSVKYGLCDELTETSWFARSLILIYRHKTIKPKHVGDIFLNFCIFSYLPSHFNIFSQLLAFEDRTMKDFNTECLAIQFIFTLSLSYIQISQDRCVCASYHRKACCDHWVWYMCIPWPLQKYFLQVGTTWKIFISVIWILFTLHKV